MSRQAGRPHTRHRGDEAEAVAASQGDADGDAANTWKQEMDTIMNGTHPLLVAELKKPTQTRDTLIAQADRIRQLQTANVNALFECDKKQIEDEYVVSPAPLTCPLPAPPWALNRPRAFPRSAGAAPVLPAAPDRLDRAEAAEERAARGAWRPPRRQRGQQEAEIDRVGHRCDVHPQG